MLQPIYVSFTTVNYFNLLLESKNTVINVLYCLCVWFCLHTILIKATIWLRGFIPLLSPLIRQEGCQLWALCCRLNSQTSPLNWTLELSMCMECLPRPALMFTEGGNRPYRRTVQQAGLIGRLQWNASLIHHQSSVSGGLERNVGCCKWRRGNGSF